MSPHQRLLILAASTPKSRRIRSTGTAAPGSGTVVFFGRFGALPRSPAVRHQPGDPFTAVSSALAGQLGVDPRCSVAAPGLLVQLVDLLAQVGVGLLADGAPVGALLVVGGSGDLEQLGRLLDVAVAGLLRLDERVHVHRVSFAKKAVARLRISTSPRSLRFSRRSCASSSRSALVRPPSTRVPASRSACLTHSRTAVSVRSKSRATCPIDRSPR